MKLPLLSGRQVVRTLGRLGFEEVHRKGSYVKMRHKDGRMMSFLFMMEIDRFTLRGALRGADIDLDEFVKNIR
jgi:predicted RNA binding protein YcfA (HicA-like mRNA interferase family)